MRLTKENKGMTLIALVVTIIILLILAGISIRMLTGQNGSITKASEAKIMTVIGTVKEQIKLEQMENLMNNQKNSSVEQMLADGKVKRTVQPDGETYYMYYAIKPDSYPGMQGLGKGVPATLRDVFLIDDEFHVKYIDKNGKEYGDKIEEKILEDETEITFASKAFSKYVSLISGAQETAMKFEWMKNQKSLTIADSSIDSLEDLVFFPNLTTLTLGDYSGNRPLITTLDGVENCKELTNISIIGGPDKDYTALASLVNLKSFFKNGGNDYDRIIDALKLCRRLESFTLLNYKINNMSRIGELSNLKSLRLNGYSITKIEGLENMSNLTTLDLSYNKITKIEGLENLLNLSTLNLEGNQITDITPLSMNTSLMSLNLKGNTGIDGNRNNYTGERLNALNKIGEILDKNGTISVDVDKIKLFTNYKKLELANQNLLTLESAEGLKELTYLNAGNNQITLEDEKSQEILRSMTNLEILNLSGNAIKNVTVINSLRNLRVLYITGAKNNINLAEIEDIISDLENLRVSTESLKTIENCDINKITKLCLGNSDLSALPDLSRFIKLTKLDLTNNTKIVDFNIVSNVSSLQILNLNGTNLHGRMIDFSKLTNLMSLNLSNNTLWTEDLDNLQALRNNTNLTINLSNNSIIDASRLLVLDPSCKIDLRNNVNLSQESKDDLRERFGNNVTF